MKLRAVLIGAWTLTSTIGVACSCLTTGLVQAQVYIEQITPTPRPSGHSKIFVRLPDTQKDETQVPVPGTTNGLLGGPALTGPLSPGSLSSVIQAGVSNTAAAVIYGADNSTAQVQTGTGNMSDISVTGSVNTVATSQWGNANASSVALVGNSNSLSNTQIGSGLSYTLQHVGNGQSISVTQVR